MSYVSWVEIYGDYSDADLATEIADLRKALKGGFTGQTVGGKSYTKDTKLLGDQLRAATRVKNQRASGGRGRDGFVGVADFSGGVDGSVRSEHSLDH